MLLSLTLEEGYHVDKASVTRLPLPRVHNDRILRLGGSVLWMSVQLLSERSELSMPISHTFRNTYQDDSFQRAIEVGEILDGSVFGRTGRLAEQFVCDEELVRV